MGRRRHISTARSKKHQVKFMDLINRSLALGTFDRRNGRRVVSSGPIGDSVVWKGLADAVKYMKLNFPVHFSELTESALKGWLVIRHKRQEQHQVQQEAKVGGKKSALPTELLASIKELILKPHGRKGLAPLNKSIVMLDNLEPYRLMRYDKCKRLWCQICNREIWSMRLCTGW